MRELAGVALAAALLIGMSTLAVERFHDRETFTSPPDAVAEGFVREVVTKRWDRAKPYLVEPESMSDDDLEMLQKSWGEPSRIEAELISRDDEQALVHTTLKSAGGSEVVAFALTFDGEWKITTERLATAVH
jgi:hypothetical protein